MIEARGAGPGQPVVEPIFMFSGDSSNDQRNNRKAVFIVAIAVLTVAVILAGALTWNNIQEADADFKRDCKALGGETHSLGDETVCIVEGKQVVIGRE